MSPRASRLTLRVVALGYLALLLLLAVAMVFERTLADGVGAAWAAVTTPEAQHAFYMTMVMVLVAVPANTVFGVFLALALVRGRWRGKRIVSALIDLPFAVSPVVVGLALVLVYGRGGWLAELPVQVLFSIPGIVLATVFITFPFVARELIPLMQAQGSQDEEAALSLGASGWQTFRRVTLPNVKWALLYGVLLCNARAMGEFGAVSVVSGHIRGKTNTMPLHVEILYNEYNFVAAFAVASLLALLALVTLVLKTLLEWRYGDELARRAKH